MKIHFITPNNQYNGYGMAEAHLKKYFAREGIELVKKYGGEEISLVLNLPTALVHAKGRIKILYIMIEGDTYPQEWISLCKKATAVIVPNHWCQKVLEKVGIKTTIIPLGYDPEVFKPRLREIHTPYTFLHYEAFQNRKGWNELLDAWVELDRKEDTRLILKTIKPWDEVSDRVKQFVNVKVISGELPHEAIASLLHAADCFVFPSRGEGFSLPPLEAMACGLPVILTKGHSHLDYYNEEFMYGVDIKEGLPARYPWFNYQIGHFIRADIDDLEEVLNHVYENKEEAFKKGQKAKEYVKDFTIFKTVKNFKDFIKGVSK